MSRGCAVDLSRVMAECSSVSMYLKHHQDIQCSVCLLWACLFKVTSVTVAVKTPQTMWVIQDNSILGSVLGALTCWTLCFCWFFIANVVWVKSTSSSLCVVTGPSSCAGVTPQVKEKLCCQLGWSRGLFSQVPWNQKPLQLFSISSRCTP